MVEQALTALAAAGGATLAGAIATDAWSAAKRGFATLLGQGGGAEHVKVIEGRLDLAAGRVAALSGPDLDRERASQAMLWRHELEKLLNKSLMDGSSREVVPALQDLISSIKELTASPSVMATGDNSTAIGSVRGRTAFGAISAPYGTVTISTPADPTAPGTTPA
jgi:hypothetical protein